MKHKHAELIKAWADGADIEYFNKRLNIWFAWDIKCSPSWQEDTEYRIKPPEVAQWRKDMAQALKDGKEVQFYDFCVWVKSNCRAEEFLDPEVTFFNGEKSKYRIKPYPKPDVVEFYNFFDKYNPVIINQHHAHLKLIWDGESGALKGAEVLS